MKKESCRDVELKDQVKDLIVDFYFSNSTNNSCISTDLFNNEKSFNFNNILEDETKVKFKVFKIRLDYCKCHGDYANLNKRYKDSIFIYPYKIEFQKFSKKEIRGLRNNLPR